MCVCLDTRINADLKQYNSQTRPQEAGSLQICHVQEQLCRKGDEIESQFNVERLIEMLRDKTCPMKESQQKKVFTDATEEENDKEEKTEQTTTIEEQCKVIKRNSSLNLAKPACS